MPPAFPLTCWISATASKAGNRPEQNEDAIAASPETLRFAVTDGATEGWESGRWATHLAAAYVDGPPSPVNFPEWVATTRQAWKTTPQNGSAPWYAEVKQRAGSFSTLLGVEFRMSPQASAWTWKAVAIGDSCLFQIRSGHVETSFPITTASGFGNHPSLISSSPATPCPEPEWLAGRSEPQDLFLLATDAVAAYLTRLATPDAWSPFLVAIHEGLRVGKSRPLLDWFRSVRAVRNDDLSVVAIRIPDATETSR